jgi:histone-lysine N-methyltransferase SETMAR
MVSKYHRSVLLFLYRAKYTAKDAAKWINDVDGGSGRGTVSQSQAYWWFDRFRSGDDSIDDRSRSGRPRELDLKELEEALDAVDGRASSRELGEWLGFDHKTILNGLHALGRVEKHTRWIPKNLTEGDRANRVKMSQALLELQRRDPSLPLHTIAGDETMVSLSNPAPKHAWVRKGDPGPTAVRQQFPKQRMVCFFFDAYGFIHVEIMQEGKKVDSIIYCQQLERVAAKLRRCRPYIIRSTYLLQDNASPHRANLTMAKIEALGWTKLPHPPYSPDLNPTDYGVNRALKESIKGQEFKNEEQLVKFLNAWCESRPPGFFERQFKQLSMRWKAVIKAEGDYFDEAEIKKELNNMSNVVL